MGQISVENSDQPGSGLSGNQHLLRLAANGDLFLLDGSSGTQQAVSQSAYGLKFVAASDLNGDGRADILLRDNSGALLDWTMNGATVQQAELITTLAAGQQVAQVVGASSTTPAKILLQNAVGTAPWMLLQMDGAHITAATDYRSQPTL